MGQRHLLCLLLPLALYALLTTHAAGPPRTPKGNRTQGATVPRRSSKQVKEQLNHTLASTPPSAVPAGSGGSRARGGVGDRGPPRAASSGSAGSSSPAYDTCMGYYDVSGQWDKEFECNNSQKDFRYCCGTCNYRFCCNKRSEKLNQYMCRNNGRGPTTDSMTTATSNGGPGEISNVYDPNEDTTNATVYISCGAIAFVVIAGIFAKVAYDKARQPPQEMNIHRALADILRQQGPIPIAHCDRETISAIESSSKDNTPVRTSSKNHYTPVRTSKSNLGHYGKDFYRSGGPDFHNFISSGFVTLGRGHSKEKPRMNSILTSATEPYDLSFSRSFQNLSHLPPSYESAIKTNPTDKDAEEYYSRKRHLPDLAARGTLPLNVIQLSQKQTNQRERPRRVIRAMSQDRVLSPERVMPEEFSMSYERILSNEQLLSTERLHSQDPLLSPEHSGIEEQSMSRALSHSDIFVSTPVLDRYRMTKMHSHPSASNNLYNTLSMNKTSEKRQAFASRRHNTVEQLHYIPGHHHYHTGSKTEVTV
ncbi:protein shisa-6 isoform X2 [Heteronotia binoei]|uniref:protein shisa-6 isoform X2 n=1 Tax=Heteronotia binoei TaxID=13085 RepID=UPI00292D8A0C|nr:protein shisa-6 isoform X2 [Heteronotia binoei]